MATKEIVPVISFYDLILETDKDKLTAALSAANQTVTALCKEATSEQCTVDTLAAYRKRRAALNKERNAAEAMRKDARKKLLSRHDMLMPDYQKNIIKPFDDALKAMDDAIVAAEAEAKAQKTEAVKNYFTEYVNANHMGDYVKWSDLGVTITLSESEKKLKDTVRGRLDNILRNYKFVADSEFPAEAIAEFKLNGFDGMAAVQTIKERHRAAEEEAERIRQEQAFREQMAALEAEKQALIEEAAEEEQDCDVIEPAVEIAEEAVEAPQELAPPAEETVEEEPVEQAEPDDIRFQLTFTVRGTLNELKALKAFLIENKYEIVE